MCRFLSTRLLLAATLVSLIFWFISFDAYGPPTAAEIHRAKAAIVFTGQFERIDRALDLLASGSVPLVFITGLNAGAGLSPDTFAAQFSERNPAIGNMQQLISCCMAWGIIAQNTLQNGDESKCWLESRQIAGPIVLVTGRGHMARAYAALRAAGVTNNIFFYPVNDAETYEPWLRQRTLEFVKLLGLSLAGAIPWLSRDAELHGPFASGCGSAVSLRRGPSGGERAARG